MCHSNGNMSDFRRTNLDGNEIFFKERYGVSEYTFRAYFIIFFIFFIFSTRNINFHYLKQKHLLLFYGDGFE